MNIILTIVWVLAMMIYSFSSDYAISFPNYKNREVFFVRWGALLVAMGLSFYLAKVYKAHLQGSGIWIFIAVAFVIITLSKLLFKWMIKRQR